MRNRKSQLEDLFPLMLLMVFLVFMFIFASCTSQNKGNKLKEYEEFQSLSIDSAQLLNSFLKSNFSLQDYEESDIADAISHYFLDEDKKLREDIKVQTKKIFSTTELESDTSFWSLEIKYPGKTLKIESDNARAEISRKLISIITLPSHNPDKLIEIKLFISGTRKLQ
tara:strand:- start:1752 stop:2255 length:504 start_codon:yes stop_codon:yes gene_type:complete